ncbi:MAG: hypothetical protein PCFJNLEI_01891 [Verrucomicrobiae bacterium]|nr:hypothetical protein [Verrucomicrobiae bacterium]
MKTLFFIGLLTAGSTFAQLIETNLETGIILLPVKDRATHAMLRASLRENDPLLRIQGLVALQTIRDPADLELISQMTNDPIATVREQALNRPPPAPVSVIKAPTNPAEVRQGLSNNSRLTQQLAVDAVAKLQLTDLAAELLPLLESSDSVLRRHVCEALGTLRVEQSAALARQLARDDDPFVRRAAAEALVAIHSDQGRAALMELLHHQNALVRAESARALGGWRQPAIATMLHPLLLDTDAQVARAAADAIGQLGNPASRQPMLAALTKCQPFAQARVVWALGALRATDAVPALIELIKTGSDETQSNAAEALGKLGDTQAVLPLRKVLTDMRSHGPTTRQRAIEALRLLGDRDSIKRIMQIITEKIVPPPPGSNEPSYDMDDTRAEGVRYLEYLGIPALGEQMLAKLTDMPSYTLRQVIAGMLSKLNGQPYMAAYTTDCRHYLMESSDGEYYPQSPPPPGVVPVP